MTAHAAILHAMTYVGIDADLAELWRCPTCGRVLLLDVARRWRDVRVEGDGQAAHTGCLWGQKRR